MINFYIIRKKRKGAGDEGPAGKKPKKSKEEIEEENKLKVCI